MTAAELKSLRETLGITQRRLANMLDVDPSTIARWESRSASQRRPIPRLAGLAIVHVLNCDGGAG